MKFQNFHPLFAILHPWHRLLALCWVTPFEQEVPEITTVGSHLKGDYLKNSPPPPTPHFLMKFQSSSTFLRFFILGTSGVLYAG
jgi:hypothetical protein